MWFITEMFESGSAAVEGDNIGEYDEAAVDAALDEALTPEPTSYDEAEIDSAWAALGL